MTYPELIDAVRRQYSPAVLESVQFETNRGGLDADDLYWDMNDAGIIDGVEIMAWQNEQDSINDAGGHMEFRKLFPLT